MDADLIVALLGLLSFLSCALWLIMTDGGQGQWGCDCPDGRHTCR